jgi:NAD-dependent dihydropyrimidine dehydrogenase PreA subunit
MANRLTIVISQGQSNNPAKRRLEEALVGTLLLEPGLEVTVIPNLYDLAPDGTGMLCLQGITGDMVVLSWLYARAAHWTLDRNGIRGRVGQVLLAGNADAEDEDEEKDGKEDGSAEGEQDAKPRVLESRPASNRTIYCLDLRAKAEAEPYLAEIRRIRDEAAVQTVSLLGWIGGTPQPEQLDRYLKADALPANGSKTLDQAGGDPQPVAPATAETAQPVVIAEEPARRWYPVIDYSRCTNCMECIDFCLFGVYGVDRAETILVEQPDNCRKGCPACSRVCPENAIIFPQHKTPAIAGSPDGSAGALKIDLSKLFGAPDALDVAVLERDVELVAVGRDAVGATVGIPKRQPPKKHGPRDDLDDLMDELDNLVL